MTSKTKLMLATAAMSGMLAGAATRTYAAAPAASTGDVVKAKKLAADDAKKDAGKKDDAKKDAGKHDCKGKNDCKGQGGCKTGDAGCKGKNSCKGKGGCSTKEEAKK